MISQKATKQVRSVQTRMFMLTLQILLFALLTLLGIYCSYESVMLISRKGIFLKENSKLGTAAQRFCDSLQKLIVNYSEIVDVYIRSSRTNTHGIRKGSATYSISCTTVPPSMVQLHYAGSGVWERYLMSILILANVEIIT